MPKVVPTTTLLKRLIKLTERLTEIVGRDFPPLTAEQLTWSAQPDQWSILECLEHLNLVFQAHLPRLERVVQQAQKKGTKAQPLFKYSWLGQRQVEQLRLQTNNQIKSPIESPEAFQPKAFQDTTQHKAILNDFLQYQTQLLALLKACTSVNLQKNKVRGTAVGGFVALPLGDVLRGIVYHIERHVVQAQRVHYHDDFPSQSSSNSA